MKFSEYWLREWVNPALTTDELTHLLTMAGLEVEACESVAPPLPGVVIGEILAAEPHPQADRLRVCQVSIGGDAPLQIVCGAPNARVGIKIPCATIGAVLPGDFVIKEAVLRGVASFGMLCSAKELQLVEDADGLYELPLDAPVGQTITEYLALNDQLITIKLTPNRADCLSMSGVAREVAALTRAPLTVPQWSETQPEGTTAKAVNLTAGDACPRYVGQVIENVNAAQPTPAWMVQKLQRAGLRSISLLVDITNFVMLELGQPLHAFDAATLQGDITVRWAENRETLTLLNDKTIELTSDMLVIADASGPVALAGIMGGKPTEVTSATQNVFLEAAFFAPAAIAGRARRLTLSSDAAHRFERGVDFEATRHALNRATALIVELAGGQAGPVTEVIQTLPARPPVRLRLRRLARLLGIALPDREVINILTLLGMSVVQAGDDILATPPSHRFDLQIEEDLAEEIARVYGYDAIPPILPPSSLGMLATPEAGLNANTLLARAIACDYQQVINFAFVEARWERELAGNSEPIKLLNPIASQLAVMRSSLIGGLINTLANNLARKQSRVRIVEQGRVFLGAGDAISQPEKIAGLAYGPCLPEQWGVAASVVDFFDVKGDVMAMLSPLSLIWTRGAHPACHPGRCAMLSLNGAVVGFVGELHPEWVQGYDLPAAPVVFELDAALLNAHAVPKVGAISRFQPIRRDLALLVEQDLVAHALLSDLRENAPEGVTEIEVFDVYIGQGVPTGKKSLALRIVLHDTQKTLTEAEVDAVMTSLINTAASHGASLRN